MSRLFLIIPALLMGCGAAATTTGYKRCSVADAAYAMHVEEGGSAEITPDMAVVASGPVTLCVGKESALFNGLLPMALRGAAASQGIPLPPPSE